MRLYFANFFLNSSSEIKKVFADAVRHFERYTFACAVSKVCQEHGFVMFAFRRHPDIEVEYEHFLLRLGDWRIETHRSETPRAGLGRLVNVRRIRQLESNALYLGRRVYAKQIHVWLALQLGRTRQTGAFDARVPDHWRRVNLVPNGEFVFLVELENSRVRGRPEPEFDSRVGFFIQFK